MGGVDPHPVIIGGRSTSERLDSGRLELPLNTLDIAPTTLGLCGLQQPEWMHGFDYSGARRHGDTSLERAPESAFLQYCLHDSPFLDWVWCGVITADGWKYVALEGQPFAMFDLNRDPYELENLAFRRVSLAQRRRLQGLLALDRRHRGPLHAAADLRATRRAADSALPGLELGLRAPGWRGPTAPRSAWVRR